ncbi:hypothetical protein Y032_0133g1771 [Ancylostoma ceylanicum]|uniref:Uncharacterized protein n=1 Tax=Ancylostoma ceylanicum TaxID=53326 RepID=A0A016T5H0_9BILA|nr:hypothetical protein Y032_0133g1771 [Ancylostoma ceylanicum]
MNGQGEYQLLSDRCAKCPSSHPCSCALLVACLVLQEYFEIEADFGNTAAVSRGKVVVSLQTSCVEMVHYLLA